MTDRPTVPDNTQDSRTYYLVRVALTPQKDFNDRQGVVWEWLCVDEGYASHTSSERRAEKFDGIPTQELIDLYSGCPWYCVHDKRFKPQIIRVTEQHSIAREIIQ